MSPKPTLYSTPTLNPATTQILITGASGFIAANIIREALELGYHVRGTARTAEKAANTVKEQNNHPNYTTAVVPDFAEPSAELTAAVKGVDSIIHVASDTSFSEDAEAVVSGVVHSVQNVLRAAVAEPRVKRFTLTSSSTAALLVKPGVEGIVATVDTWNEEAVRAAKKGEGVGSNPLPFVVYAASKTEGEKALWEFVSKEKPNFVANAILPNWNLGRVVGSAGATGMLVPEVFKKGREALSWFVPRMCRWIPYSSSPLIVRYHFTNNGRVRRVLRRRRG